MLHVEQVHQALPDDDVEAPVTRDDDEEAPILERVLRGCWENQAVEELVKK